VDPASGETKKGANFGEGKKYRRAENKGQYEGEIFSWLGIIMYLPEMEENNDKMREEITKAFVEYRKECGNLWKKFRAKQHWAKIEKEELRGVQSSNEFSSLRKKFDPHNIFLSGVLEKIYKNDEERIHER